jgi:hypothetical protein
MMKAQRLAVLNVRCNLGMASKPNWEIGPKKTSQKYDLSVETRQLELARQDRWYGYH